jgi:FixJ family two-component response regulator
MRRPRSEGPACLVLDVRLPGLSSLDLQRELTNSGIELPIIFMTAHGDIPMTVRAMKGGAMEFLTKPFRTRRLLDAIRAAIEREGTRSNNGPRSPNCVTAMTCSLRASERCLLFWYWACSTNRSPANWSPPKERSNFIALTSGRRCGRSRSRAWLEWPRSSD